MKVKELIEKLNKIENQDREVLIRFALDSEDEIGYILEPFAVENFLDTEVYIYSHYGATEDDCAFVGQVDLKQAYKRMLEEE